MHIVGVHTCENFKPWCPLVFPVSHEVLLLVLPAVSHEVLLLVLPAVPHEVLLLVLPAVGFSVTHHTWSERVKIGILCPLVFPFSHEVLLLVLPAVSEVLLLVLPAVSHEVLLLVLPAIGFSSFIFFSHTFKWSVKPWRPLLKEFGPADVGVSL